MCTAGQRVVLTITGLGLSFYYANLKLGGRPEGVDVLYNMGEFPSVCGGSKGTWGGLPGLVGLEENGALRL